MEKLGQHLVLLDLGMAVLLALCLTPAACGTPISVESVDARTVQTELTSNALTTGRLSESLQIVLRRLDLLGVYDENRPAAIRSLSAIQAADTDNRDLLSEMAFLQAESANDQSYFLATVVYSYAFLFPASPASRPDPFGPRLRTAADLYNRALTLGLAPADGQHVDLRVGDYPLPFGSMSINLAPSALRWGGFELTGFTPAAELQIEGLQNRSCESGIGAPLAADLRTIGDPRGFQVARFLKVPVTALLRSHISPAAMASGRFAGNLTMYLGDEYLTVTINGRQVPLENEPSAAFAYTLSNPAIWKTELAGFFHGDLFDAMPTQLAALEPYRQGRIPVVLIHGTASGAGRWADLINDLQNDPAIRERFQFWLFVYNTGNPILLSALQLGAALTAAISKLDLDRHDPPFHNTVMVGRSQASLLAKMLVINSGPRTYDAFSSRPIDQLALTNENRETLREVLFVTPLSDVTRVIFIATPHRGSFVADHSLASRIGRFVTMPLRVTRLAAETVAGNRDAG